MNKNKGFASIAVIGIIVLVVAIGGSLGFYYYNNLNQSSSNILTTNKETSHLAGWENYKFENYGLEFQLPEGWEQIESLDGTSTLVFSPKSAEYYTRPEHQHLRIIIQNQENPNKLPYEKLNKLSELEMENYNKGDDTIVGGKPTKITYENIYQEINQKTDPVAIIQLDNKFIFIIWPQENDDYNMFHTFLSMIKFFDPIQGIANSSKPVKQEPITNRAEWCAKAPVPGDCLSKLAKTEKTPDVSWCNEITLENSRSDETFYYLYKNECYKYAASKLKDISLCDKVAGEGQYELNKSPDTRDCKSWVNYELALQNKDIKYCGKIDLNTFIDGYGGKAVTYMNCYADVAKSLNDQHICDKIDLPQSKAGSDENKKWCHYYYAVEKKDCSLLPPNLSALKSQCESFVKNGI